MKKQKPRKQEGKTTLNLSFKDGKASIDLREGHTPILNVKDQKFKTVNEVLEMLNRKL